jgi:hypothetical protein
VIHTNGQKAQQQLSVNQQRCLLTASRHRFIIDVPFENPVTPHQALSVDHHPVLVEHQQRSVDRSIIGWHRVLWVLTTNPAVLPAQKKVLRTALIQAVCHAAFPERNLHEGAVISASQLSAAANLRPSHKSCKDPKLLCFLALLGSGNDALQQSHHP